MNRDFREKSFKHKTLDDRVHRGIPIKRKKVTPAPVMDVMINWWDLRLREGTQLTDIQHYRPSFDYRGTGPWFRYVAVPALYHDFISYRDDLFVTRLSFLIYFRRVVGDFKLISKTGRLNKSDGTMFLRPRRQYIRFEAKQIYIERIQKAYENENDSEGSGVSPSSGVV